MTTLPVTGELSMSAMRNAASKSNPVSMSHFYNLFTPAPFPTTGIIGFGDFRGKSFATVSVEKTFSATTGQFSAPGSPGAILRYTSSAITLPLDYKTVVRWDLTFYAIKQNSSFGWAYPTIGITNGPSVGVAGSSTGYQSITRTWTGQTTNLPNTAGQNMTFFVEFYTGGNLTNCYFKFDLTYKT